MVRKRNFLRIVDYLRIFSGLGAALHGRQERHDLILVHHHRAHGIDAVSYTHLVGNFTHSPISIPSLYLPRFVTKASKSPSNMGRGIQMCIRDRFSGLEFDGGDINLAGHELR